MASSSREWAQGGRGGRYVPPPENIELPLCQCVPERPRNRSTYTTRFVFLGRIESKSLYFIVTITSRSFISFINKYYFCLELNKAKKKHSSGKLPRNRKMQTSPPVENNLLTKRHT